MNLTNTELMAETLKVFQVLIRGRIVEKNAISNRLLAKDPFIDRAYLRELIMEALQGEYDASSVSRNPDSPKAWTRCWLLSSLGRVADEDTTAVDYLRGQTDIANEPNDWARFWALESLVVSGSPDLDELVNNIVSNDNDTLVINLAKAIKASRGDDNALKEILKGIETKKRFTLRALQVVQLEEAVIPLRNIVINPEFTDETYDAIVALGLIPEDWLNANKAGDALIACIKESRRHPWWDEMRRKALIALKNLKTRDAEPVLIEELSDSNPSIVYEAAQALEGIFGIQRATARIVEAASQTGKEAVLQYANALRWMNREEVVEKLESLMLSGPTDQQETARELLGEVGGHSAFEKLEKLRARKDAMKQHLVILENTERSIRETFDSSLKEARSGYKLATFMDAIVFLLGVGFLVITAILVLNGKESIAGLTGGGGSLAVLYNLLLGNPRRRVKDSVAHLMSLKSIFLSYSRQLHQTDQAFSRRLMDDSNLTPDIVKQYSDLLSAMMNDAVSKILTSSSKSKVSAQ